MYFIEKPSVRQVSVTWWSVVISGYSRILHPKKTDYKDITEILLKVALNTITLTPLHENVLELNSSQIIEIFNYLNISPIIIKNKIFLVVVL
jgi:hypothetical protein